MQQIHHIRNVHRCVASIREPESDFSTGNNDKDFDDTPLTRADVPKIVEAVNSNIPKETEDPEEKSQDNPHLGM